MNVCREKFIFQGETLNCENWKWKENNHFKSDSTALNPLLLKLYSVYIAASNKKIKFSQKQRRMHNMVAPAWFSNKWNTSGVENGNK